MANVKSATATQRPLRLGGRIQSHDIKHRNANKYWCQVTYWLLPLGLANFYY